MNKQLLNETVARVNELTESLPLWVPNKLNQATGYGFAIVEQAVAAACKKHGNEQWDSEDHRELAAQQIAQLLILGTACDSITGLEYRKNEMPQSYGFGS